MLKLPVLLFCRKWNLLRSACTKHLNVQRHFSQFLVAVHNEKNIVINSWGQILLVSPYFPTDISGTTGIKWKSLGPYVFSIQHNHVQFICTTELGSLDVSVTWAINHESNTRKNKGGWGCEELDVGKGVCKSL